MERVPNSLQELVEDYSRNADSVSESAGYDEGEQVAETETLTMDFHHQDDVKLRVARV